MQLGRVVIVFGQASVYVPSTSTLTIFWQKKKEKKKTYQVTCREEKKINRERYTAGVLIDYVMSK